MRTVFGIDVSKANSEVAILVNGEKVLEYSIPNDAIGFCRLYHDLNQVVHPEIVFQATGVYSRRLEAFLSASLVLETPQLELENIIRQSTAKRISEKRVQTLTVKLLELVEQSYPAIVLSSPMLETVRYYAQELLRLNVQRQAVLEEMVVRAQTLPEYNILLSIPGIA